MAGTPGFTCYHGPGVVQPFQSRQERGRAAAAEAADWLRMSQLEALTGQGQGVGWGPHRGRPPSQDRK